MPLLLRPGVSYGENYYRNNELHWRNQKGALNRLARLNHSSTLTPEFLMTEVKNGAGTWPYAFLSIAPNGSSFRVLHRPFVVEGINQLHFLFDDMEEGEIPSAVEAALEFFQEIPPVDIPSAEVQMAATRVQREFTPTLPTVNETLRLVQDVVNQGGVAVSVVDTLETITTRRTVLLPPSLVHLFLDRPNFLTGFERISRMVQDSA